ncbi:MAG: glycosyltransferase [Nanoarchaeota archaeon]
MGSNPKISIIMPTFNVKRAYLEKTIESIRNQTLSNEFFETVIVDDCSSDDTPKNVREMISVLEGQVLFEARKKNLGPAARRNEAIKMSRGEYVAILDADDVLEPNSLLETLRFFEQNPGLQYSYSKHRRIDPNGNFVCDRPCYKFSRERLLHFNFVGPFKCFRRDLHHDIGGYNTSLKFAEDWDHVLRASEVLPENGIKQNTQFLYNYRVFLDSLSVRTDMSDRIKFVTQIIESSLKRKEGLDAKVFFSHMTDDQYTFYDWKLK